MLQHLDMEFLLHQSVTEDCRTFPALTANPQEGGKQQRGGSAGGRAGGRAGRGHGATFPQRSRRLDDPCATSQAGDGGIRHCSQGRRARAAVRVTSATLAARSPALAKRRDDLIVVDRAKGWRTRAVWLPRPMLALLPAIPTRPPGTSDRAD